MLKTVSTPAEAPAGAPQNARSMLLIGNGPSTRKLVEYGFENLPAGLDTFGMGAAYRFYEQINWWPDYYAWCDVKVVHSHRGPLKALIEDENVGTRRFFFSLPISDHPRLETIPHGSTGDFCFRKAVELGYDTIYMIGIEGDYVEELTEARRLTDEEFARLGYHDVLPEYQKTIPQHIDSEALFRDTLRIIERTPQANPNYFFEGYQRAGDVYSKPRAQTHRNSWSKSAALARERGAHIVNLSETSKVEDFYKAPWTAFREEVLTPAPKREPFAPYNRPVEAPAPLTESEKREAVRAAGLPESAALATLIIGARFPEGQPERLQNLLFLLDWIDRFYGDLFDVLIVEQDSVSRIDAIRKHMRPYVRCEFIYNPGPYNRGWGYNAAVRHFTTAPVVGLLDTDVLLGANFVQEVIDCHHKYKAISPYASVYFTDEDEAARILLTFGLDRLDNIERLSKPVTICGGIVIIRRDVYCEHFGFEQYTEYAGEDRSLDVTLLNHCDESEIRIAPFTYAHMHHPKGADPRPNMKALFQHLRENYGCRVDPTLTPEDYVHQNCKHVDAEKTRRNARLREETFGDLNLYRSNRPLTINGVYAGPPAAAPSPAPEEPKREVIYPPAFKGLDAYEAREIFDAPPPDFERIGALYNKFKGERCFIVGNGPSLNQHDLSLLKDEYSFAVNSIYYKTDETGYRPTFFVVEDSSVMAENIDRIKEYEAPYKFFPTNYKSLHPEGDNVYFFKMNRSFYEKSSPFYCIPRFSADASKVLYCGQSVTYINLQLAYFMGFTEVYLIGMDFSYVIPKEHKRRGDIIESTTDDPNHFHKDYFGVGKTWKDPKLERVGANYRQAKLSYEAVGRKIYNATIGGKLDIFDRVDYDALLKSGRKVVTRPVQAPDRSAAPTAPGEAAATAAQRASAPVMRGRPDGAPPAAGQAPRPFYYAFAEDLKQRSPRLFALLQFARRAGAGFFRRGLWTLPAAAILAGLVVLGFFLPDAGARLFLWTATGFAALGFALFYLALRVFIHLTGLSARADQMQKTLSQINAGRARTAKDIGNLRSDLSAVKTRTRTIERESQGAVSRLSDTLRGQQASLDAVAGEAKDMTAKLERRLERKLEQLNAALDSRLGTASERVDEQISEIKEKVRRDLDNIQQEAALAHTQSMSLETLSVMRALRPLWLGGSAVDRLQRETTVEHGQAVFMAALADEERRAPGTLAGKVIVEVGTTRELRLPQNSTQKLAIFAAATDMYFISVDMDPDNTRAANRILPYINPSATAWTRRGEDFLRTYAGPIDYVYLDAFDFDHDQHSEHRRDRYRSILKTDINDEDCWLMHKECAQILINRMPEGGIVALDDTWTNADGAYQGKGKLAAPLLLENGFEIVAKTRETLCLKRTAGDGASGDASESGGPGGGER